MTTDGNAFGEKIFFWVDEDGVRCGPRHRTMKAALGYFKDQDSRWVRDEATNRPQRVAYDRTQFPSQKSPIKLRVGEYVERDLNEDEQTRTEQVRALMRDGFV
jgi:hypothetical protein